MSLLRALTKVHVSFNPLNAGSRSAREFLRQATGPQAKASNPECAVSSQVHSTSSPAKIEVTMEDNSSYEIWCEGRTMKQIKRDMDLAFENMRLIDFHNSLPESDPMKKKL
eukprot:GFYU01025633.1.p1 GENE.GFYU01025633.1~~GFYU01025633.1.p1  ORF type:complete len:111 (+),score=16.75 GFYU01025633.1:49-381(+)